MQSLIIRGENVLPFILCVILLFLIIIIICLESGFLEHSFVPLFFSICIISPIYLLMNKFVRDKFYSKIFLIAILLHYIVLVFWEILKYHILGFPLPNEHHFYPFTSDNDGALFHSLGVDISKSYSVYTIFQKYTGGLFPKLIGTVYYIFGVNPYIVCIINSIFASLIAPILYFIGQKVLENKSKAKVYSLISILTFSHLINTTVLMRDGYITLFMYLTIFLFYFFYKNLHILYLLLSFCSLFLLYCFRPYASFVLFFALITAWVIPRIKINFNKKIIKTNLITIILIICSPIIIGGILFLLLKISSFMNLFSVEDLIHVREVSYQYGDAEIGFDFGILYSKFFLLPFIVGYFYLFTAPFPWTWTKIARIIYVPDMLILYLFLPSFIKGLLNLFKDKNFFLLTFFFSMLFMFSFYCITLGNAGAIHRLRGPFVPMIYLIAMSNPNKFLSKILYKIQKWRFV